MLSAGYPRYEHTRRRERSSKFANKDGFNLADEGFTTFGASASDAAASAPATG